MKHLRYICSSWDGLLIVLTIGSLLILVPLFGANVGGFLDGVPLINRLVLAVLASIQIGLLALYGHWFRDLFRDQSPRSEEK